MIKVLICDDQMVVREGLRAILSTVTDIEVVGAAANGSEAVELAARLQPDIVLMDLKMPVMNGIQATHTIRSQYPHIKVLILTTYDLDEWVFDAIRAGAAGYLLKDTPRQDLAEALRGTAEGKTYVDPSVAGKLFAQLSQGSAPPDPALLKELSERELDVLRLVAQGMNNAEIASVLYLSEGTIRNYVSSILSKLQVTDRTQAAVLALRAGLGNPAKSGL